MDMTFLWTFLLPRETLVSEYEKVNYITYIGERSNRVFVCRQKGQRLLSVNVTV